jgi:hypothetical protein
MAVRWTFDDGKKLMNIVGEGGITRADLDLLFDAVVEHGALGYSKLVDFRQTDPAMSGEEMLEVGVRARTLHGQGRMGPLALVLPADRGAEAERLIGMVSVADRPMRIFRDLGQATRWLAGQKPAGEAARPQP